MYLPAYVQIEGTWHEIAEDEKTVCGIVVPYPGTLLTRETPDKVHCGDKATVEPTEDAVKTKAKKPAAKAKAKK